MKKIVFLFIIIVMTGCVLPLEHPVPPIEEQVTTQTANTEISAIFNRVQSATTKTTTFEMTEDTLWIAGYVVSSDIGGNFYKEIIIQDTTQNPTQAIKINIDKTGLYNKYPVGQKILVKLNGLSAGVENGILTLGIQEGTNIARIPQFSIAQHILKTSEITEITPKEVTVETIDSLSLGLWVRINDIQFPNAIKNKTFSAETNDEFDGERYLAECATQSQALLLSTSTFASFKSVSLPQKRGTIEGVILRDFFGSYYILKINTLANINFQNERCEPYFEENFENEEIGVFQKEGWTNYIQAGTQKWEVYNDDESLGKSIHISAFRSEDNSTITWLISPRISISALQNPAFSFKSSVSFGDDSQLEVLIATDWDDNVNNITTTQWRTLPVTIATKTSNFSRWIYSGNINLNDYVTDNIYIAFRYSGDDVGEDNNGTYEIDDIIIADRTN